MKKMILFATVAMLAAPAFAGPVTEVKRVKGSSEVKTRDQKAKEAKDAAAARTTTTNKAVERAQVQEIIDQKAMADDLVRQGKADTQNCDTSCVKTLETVQDLVNDSNLYENDATAKQTVNGLLLEINQGVVKTGNMGQSVDKAAEKAGLNKEDLVEACRK